MSSIVETEIPLELKSDENALKTIRDLQESYPSENVHVLRAFLHLMHSAHPPAYPSDFVDYQLALLQRQNPSSILALYELVKQLVSPAKAIPSFNVVRRSMVESLVGQFRKDTQKQKWGGNGEKIQLLAQCLQRSLDLYAANDEQLRKSHHEWCSIVFSLFEPLLEELNDYLKAKLHKQQQYSALIHLVKPLSQLCEQLQRIDQTKNHAIVHEHFANIVLANLQQRIDFILSKKILEQSDSFEKLEKYTCPVRHAVFSVYPDIAKLQALLDDANLRKSSPDLIQHCNQKLTQLLEKSSNLCLNYPSSTSLEHCVCVIASLASIDIFFPHESFQFFLSDCCQHILTYWKMNLLHDCDADDWSNTKPYFENQRYSVCIDSLFQQFNRLHVYLKQYCPSLLSLVVPHMLLEFMNFIYHRYASVRASYARQAQYRVDLLGFLMYVSEFSHYFFGGNKPASEFVLFQHDHIETKFLEDGNAILAAVVLVTCPCDLLHEQMEAIVHGSAIAHENMSWLEVIRPDWFDGKHELRLAVRAFFAMRSAIETRQNNPLNHQLLPFLIDNSELDPYQSFLIELIMKNEQCELMDFLVRRQRDWSFMADLSAKLPDWLTSMMTYWMEFFTKCCYLCASEKEVGWRSKIQPLTSSENPFDEKCVYLKSLQHYLANIPFSLHQLLAAINHNHPQFSKPSILARLLHHTMLTLKIDRAAIYYSFLTDDTTDTRRTIERLLDRSSPLFRIPHGLLPNEQTSANRPDRICDVLTKNFTQIRMRLGVKTLDECGKTDSSESQPYSTYRQQSMQQKDKLSANTTGNNRAFTDLNLGPARGSIHSPTPSFKIDYALVSRVELDWDTLFTHIVARLKSSIIYHLITLRFEFQSRSSTSLNDQERLAVAKLIELLPPFFHEKA